MDFQKEILSWYNFNKRLLPWRNTTNAYVIWLSEIILQQTRVEQGMPYFNKFLAAYPTVADFASATEEEILKLWQGLGYYSRGRNMLFTAKQVMELYKGVFPTAYADLVKLKGIGDYTASAISSFSSNENKAVLDGNVFRVLSRYFGIEEAINEPKGEKIFKQLAQELILDQQASTYNQAIMEFGALQCKPKSPNCGICPLNIDCWALKNNAVNRLPLKLKKVKVRYRYFNYFYAEQGNNLLVKKRKSGDVWENMYDFPLIETTEIADFSKAEFSTLLKEKFGNKVKISLLSAKKHVLTHQIILVQFFALADYMINFSLDSEIRYVSKEEFDKLPHPKVISNFFEQYEPN